MTARRIKLVVIERRDIKRFAKRFNMTVAELRDFYRKHGDVISADGSLWWWMEEADA